MTKTVALRTALIWRDEVMQDVVLEQPAKITVGHIGKPTFTVPDIGLPKEFAIVRPGNRGYLLTLGENMRGTPGITGKLFSSLGEKNINVLAIAQGSSERNISFVIDSKDRETALNTIHTAFLGGGAS